MLRHPTRGPPRRPAAPAARPRRPKPPAGAWPTPHLAAALRSGTLSPAQATVVSAAAAADPDAEARLVDRAGTTTVEQLRRDSRNVIAAAQPCELAAQQRRAHERRCLTTRTDPDGSIIGHFRLTAIAGARLHAAIAPFHQELFDQARREGRRETHAAIAADALVAMATAAASGERGTGPRRPATIVARVDLDALQRGHTLPGEESAIDGVGPVPVPTIAALVTDAVVVALARRGEQIVDVRLAGRAMPARLRHAVIARDRHCVVPGCDRDRHCEIHHLHQVGHGGDTFLANLALVCTWHHDQLTHSDATLVRDDRPAGQPGGFTYTPTPATHPPGSPFDDDNLTWHPSHSPPVPA